MTIVPSVLKWRTSVSRGAAIGLIYPRSESGITGLTYGVRPADPLTLSAVCVILLAVAVFASFIPARAASKLILSSHRGAIDGV